MLRSRPKSTRECPLRCGAPRAPQSVRLGLVGIVGPCLFKTSSERILDVHNYSIQCYAVSKHTSRTSKTNKNIRSSSSACLLREWTALFASDTLVWLFETNKLTRDVEFLASNLYQLFDRKRTRHFWPASKTAMRRPFCWRSLLCDFQEQKSRKVST